MTGVTSGPLLVVKENIAVANQPYECGSGTRTGSVAESTAACVGAALAHGHVFAGIARCDEFGYGCTGELNARGAVPNPLDRARISGGSSSGCATAVASGAANAAIGTDTAGSARIPAAFCGIYGFKPPFGEISVDGVFPLSRSLDHVGLLADGLNSLEELYSSATGTDTDDTTPRSSTRRTIGIADQGELDVMDEHVGSCWAHVCHALEPERAGVLPGWNDAQTIGARVQGYEALRVHEATLASSAHLMRPEIVTRLRAACSISREDYLAARRNLAACRRRAEDDLGKVDVVMLPTVPVAPPRRGASVVDVGGRQMPVRGALLRNTRFANYSGLAALSLPVWTQSAVLPIGLQLVGRTSEDVFVAARQLVDDLAATGLRTSANPPSAPPTQSDDVEPIPADGDCTGSPGR